MASGSSCTGREGYIHTNIHTWNFRKMYYNPITITSQKLILVDFPFKWVSGVLCLHGHLRAIKPI